MSKEFDDYQKHQDYLLDKLYDPSFYRDEILKELTDFSSEEINQAIEKLSIIQSGSFLKSLLEEIQNPNIEYDKKTIINDYYRTELELAETLEEKSFMTKYHEEGYKKGVRESCLKAIRWQRKKEDKAEEIRFIPVTKSVGVIHEISIQNFISNMEDYYFAKFNNEIEAEVTLFRSKDITMRVRYFYEEEFHENFILGYNEVSELVEKIHGFRPDDIQVDFENGIVRFIVLNPSKGEK